jgi:hypothetical protein
LGYTREPGMPAGIFDPLPGYGSAPLRV